MQRYFTARGFTRNLQSHKRISINIIFTRGLTLIYAALSEKKMKKEEEEVEKKNHHHHHHLSRPARRGVHLPLVYIRTRSRNQA